METIRLIGIGARDAKPAGELVAGDVVVWNYGYMTPVLAVEPCGKTMVRVTYDKTINPDDGAEPTVHVRRHKRTFLVGLAALGER